MVNLPSLWEKNSVALFPHLLAVVLLIVVGLVFTQGRQLWRRAWTSSAQGQSPMP